MLRLWLDDERPCPVWFNKHVVSAPEAIKALREANGQISLVSLDHDLGENKGNGYDVAYYIEQAAFDNLLPPFECTIHTANPVARKRMQQALENAARFWYRHTKRKITIYTVDATRYYGGG